jgi:hypothetical protein
VVLVDPRNDIALALTKRGVAIARTTRSATGSFSFDVSLEKGTLTALCVRSETANRDDAEGRGERLSREALDDWTPSERPYVQEPLLFAA